MNQPLVSIITPCYNGESYLDRYFTSILTQTYPNLELIFINDGSSDRTEEIAKAYRPKLEQRGVAFTYLYQENAGQAAALNRGLKLFRGDYLTWPDADDEMSADCIEKKVAYLESHLDIDLCVCKGISVIDDPSHKQTGTLERIVPAGKETFFDDLIFIRNIFFVPGGYMVRSRKIDETIPGRDIYSGHGGQNAQLLLPVSYDGNIGYLDDYLFTYYIRESSHSHQINNARRTIEQIDRYERIILETFKRMPPQIMEHYRSTVQDHYAHWAFGNTIETHDSDLIKQYFKKLRTAGRPTLREYLLYLRYR